MPTDTTTLRRARFGVAVSFAANGLVFGTWAARIPQVREALGLSEATLGLALLSIAAGAVAAMPPAGGLIARYGSRNVTAVGSAVMAAGLAVAGFAPSLPVLIVGLACLGVGSGWQDVAMNAHGVEVERRHGRPVLSAFHGIFSLGGMLGAAVGGLAAGQNIPVAEHLAVAAFAVLWLAILAFAMMLRGRIDRTTETPLFKRPPLALLGLGLLAFGTMLAEGSVADWSAVLMRGPLGADAVTAAFAFAAFSLLMTAGRFAGDRLVERFGPVRLTRWGAILSLLGFALALTIATPAAGIVGFALVGAGLSSTIPVIYRAAAHIPGTAPGTGIAAATTLGYLGFVVGPPLIGFAAAQIGLRVSLGSMIVLLALVAAFAQQTEGATSEPVATGTA